MAKLGFKDIPVQIPPEPEGDPAVKRLMKILTAVRQRPIGITEQALSMSMSEPVGLLYTELGQCVREGWLIHHNGLYYLTPTGQAKLES